MLSTKQGDLDLLKEGSDQVKAYVLYHRRRAMTRVLRRSMLTQRKLHGTLEWYSSSDDIVDNAVQIHVLGRVNIIDVRDNPEGLSSAIDR